MTDRETILILRARHGDREALDQLLALVQDPLHRYLSRLLSDNSLADDCLQDVLIQICRALPGLREPDLFRPWAYRLASRLAFRAMRRHRTLPTATPNADTFPAESREAPDPAVIASLPGLVARVPPASRAVLLLHYAHDISIDLAAAILEIPPGTARSRLAYGLAFLRRSLNPEHEGKEP